MTTAIPVTTRSSSTALQTHRAPRTKSFGARPEAATTATISPAAQAALAAATAPPEAPTPPTTPVAPSPPPAPRPASRTPAT